MVASALRLEQLKGIKLINVQRNVNLAQRYVESKTKVSNVNFIFGSLPCSTMAFKQFKSTSTQSLKNTPTTSFTLVLRMVVKPWLESESMI